MAAMAMVAMKGSISRSKRVATLLQSLKRQNVGDLGPAARQRSLAGGAGDPHRAGFATAEARAEIDLSKWAREALAELEALTAARARHSKAELNI